MGTGAQPLQGENYTYSRVLGHVHSYFSVTPFRVVNPAFYLSLVHFPLWSQMRCREREFLHRPGIGERHVYGLGVTGAGMARVRDRQMTIYILVLA